VVPVNASRTGPGRPWEQQQAGPPTKTKTSPLEPVHRATFKHPPGLPGAQPLEPIVMVLGRSETRLSMKYPGEW